MYCRNCGAEMNENQMVCLKCGVMSGTGKSFCPNCGNAVAPEAVVCVNCGVSLEDANHEASASNVNSESARKIQKRDLVKAIILSIVTCGIYSIYWFISLTNEINTLSGNEGDTSGGTAFLLSLVTCSIYSYYWAYKMGEKRDAMDGRNNSSGILYLVLSLFGFSIVVYALLQDSINKTLDRV